MTTVLYLKEVSCPDCAKVLVQNIKKLNYIDDVVFDFQNKKMEIKSQGFENHIQKLEQIIKEEIEHSLCDYHEEKNQVHEVNACHQKEYLFENIDCPNCSIKVEKALNANEHILEAHVNFVTKKINIEYKDDLDMDALVKKIVHQVEPHAIITQEKEEHSLSKKEKFIATLKKWFPTWMGILLFFIAFLCHHVFDTNVILYYNLYIASYIFLSYDLFIKAIINMIHGELFDENLLMLIATIGAFAIQEPLEAIMVVLLYKIGESLQDYAVDKSKDAITSLVAMKIDEVTLTDGTTKNIQDVQIGEHILVKVGERIPLDGIIVKGKTSLDMKALTGEALPIYKETQDEVLSGSLNLTEAIVVKTTHTANDSTMSKVLKLVEDASNKKSKTEQFITKFAKIYTPVIIFSALIIFFIRYFALSNSLDSSLNSCFSFLVISCPCALVISIPLSFFSGIGRFSKSGILIKGGNYMEALLKSDLFVFDKTGTLTKGNFKVKEVVSTSKMNQQEVLKILAHVEFYSHHPIATSIIEAYASSIDETKIEAIEEIAGYGMKGIYEKKTIYAGNERFMKEKDISYPNISFPGTLVYVAIDNQCIGYVLIEDEIKEEAKQIIQYLKKQNKKTIMLTGDNERIASHVASTLGIDEYYANLLPEQKLNYIETFKQQNHICYVGDGINDTPALKLSDVGIAMGGCGSDQAIEAADMVIMKDDLSKIKEAMIISKWTRVINIENITFALITKLFALIFSVWGVLEGYSMLFAVFADVGVALLAVLNSMRILKK